LWQYGYKNKIGRGTVVIKKLKIHDYTLGIPHDLLDNFHGGEKNIFQWFK
jgi:hypothetical protein